MLLSRPSALWTGVSGARRPTLVACLVAALAHGRDVQACRGTTRGGAIFGVLGISTPHSCIVQYHPPFRCVIPQPQTCTANLFVQKKAQATTQSLRWQPRSGQTQAGTKAPSRWIPPDLLAEILVPRPAFGLTLRTAGALQSPPTPSPLSEFRRLTSPPPSCSFLIHNTQPIRRLDTCNRIACRSTACNHGHYCYS